MTEISERYRKVAGRFTETARSVPDGGWDNAAPCEGWVARDVVGHLVTWMPGMFITSVGLEVPQGPSVADNPAAAWEALSDAIQAGLDDPDIATRELDVRVGRYSYEDAVAMFGIGDVLIHTWDLARATGLDEALDPDEVHRMFEGMQPMDEALRKSGHFGPRVQVSADADEQTKLISFTGRQP